MDAKALLAKVKLEAVLVYKDKDGNILKTVTLQSNPEKKDGPHDQR